MVSSQPGSKRPLGRTIDDNELLGKKRRHEVVDDTPNSAARTEESERPKKARKPRVRRQPRKRKPHGKGKIRGEEEEEEGEEEKLKGAKPRGPTKGTEEECKREGGKEDQDKTQLTTTSGWSMEKEVLGGRQEDEEEDEEEEGRGRMVMGRRGNLRQNMSSSFSDDSSEEEEEEEEKEDGEKKVNKELQQPEPAEEVSIHTEHSTGKKPERRRKYARSLQARERRKIRRKTRLGTYNL
ncbi:MAG: hypothetical protein DHS80DRAFT_29875 [Piptocephalis tieghemiana]|nr:MAG: hypothetical protein DHS80DRAFT_29875 [Piptocephalis tieghemiana]